MWGKIMFPMYRLWRHGLYGPLMSSARKRLINLIPHSPPWQHEIILFRPQYVKPSPEMILRNTLLCNSCGNDDDNRTYAFLVTETFLRSRCIHTSPYQLTCHGPKWNLHWCSGSMRRPIQMLTMLLNNIFAPVKHMLSMCWLLTKCCSRWAWKYINQIVFVKV